MCSANHTMENVESILTRCGEIKPEMKPPAGRTPSSAHPYFQLPPPTFRLVSSTTNSQPSTPVLIQHSSAQQDRTKSKDKDANLIMPTTTSVCSIKRSRDDCEPTMTLSKRVKPNRSMNPTFRFLDLPAEIRNHIYEMHINELGKDGLVEIDHVAGSEAAKTSWNQESDEPEPHNVFALSQVSKQVRTEFRPLLMSKVAIRVQNTNATKYLKTFVLATEDSPSRSDTTIHVGYAGDFLPALQTCLDAPSLTCKFTGLYPKQRVMLSKIWENRNSWKEAIHNDFSAIEACHASDDLLLTMRATSQQPWKEQFSLSDSFCAPPVAMTLFFEQLGWADCQTWAKLRG